MVTWVSAMAVHSSGLWCWWLLGRGGGPVAPRSAASPPVLIVLVLVLGWRVQRSWQDLRPSGGPGPVAHGCTSCLLVGLGSSPAPGDRYRRADWTTAGSRAAAGHPAGTRGTQRSEYRSALDAGGGQVAARPAGNRPVRARAQGSHARRRRRRRSLPPAIAWTAWQHPAQRTPSRGAVQWWGQSGSGSWCGSPCWSPWWWWSCGLPGAAEASSVGSSDGTSSPASSG
jgi:hypothetical protein